MRINPTPSATAAPPTTPALSWRALSWPDRLSTLALFLVPALAVSVQSGYSYGALLLLLTALANPQRWKSALQNPWTGAFAVVLLGMGALWTGLSDPGEGWGRWDRSSKYLLGTLCLLYVSTTTPQPRAQFWGLLLGCLGGGLVALWQIYGEGMERATGFPSSHTSSAIQWGNLALLLATLLSVQTLLLRRWLGRWRCALALLAILLACNASVLSQSRGGWLALALALPVLLYLLWRTQRQELQTPLLLAGAAIVVLGALNYPMLMQRWDALSQEVLGYLSTREANNSIGHRLEHFRLAWDMGWERPWLGWGMGPYIQEKAARVAQGLYEPSVLIYHVTHNELLEMFVKTGLLGVLWLLLLYAVPLCMFWPTRQRLAAWADQPAVARAQMLALRLTGVSVVLLFAGFGLSVVYLGPNSGIMAYQFLLMLTWAALLGLERQRLVRLSPHPPCP